MNLEEDMNVEHSNSISIGIKTPNLDARQQYQSSQLQETDKEVDKMLESVGMSKLMQKIDKLQSKRGKK